jgi:hypothetical protein
MGEPTAMEIGQPAANGAVFGMVICGLDFFQGGRSRGCWAVGRALVRLAMIVQQGMDRIGALRHEQHQGQGYVGRHPLQSLSPWDGALAFDPLPGATCPA